MKRVVYYARVSTEKEEQMEALKKQEQDLINYIKTNEDWILVDKYVDEGKSGTSSKDRKQYRRLYDDLLEDKFDIILVAHQDRLMRNTLDWYLFIDRLVKNEKQLYFTLEHKFYEPDDALLTGIKAIIANQYSRDLSKKINNAHKRRQKKGIPITNGRMWGYDQGDGQLVINEKEAEIVRYVFDEYIKGSGFRKIQQKLTEKGIMNRNGNPFAMTTLKRMIKNEKYIGTLISGKKHRDFDTKKVYDVLKEDWIIHENVIPPIIQKDVFIKAQEVLNSRKKTHAGKEKEVIAGYFNGSYLYSGKIFCNKCKKVYWHQKYTTMKNDLWQCSSYRTYGKNQELGCNNNHLYTYVLDEVIKKIVFDFWQDKEKNIQNVINALDKTLKQNNYNDSVKKLGAKKIKLHNRKENLIEMRMDDEITKEEFNKQKQKIDEQLNEIDEQIDLFEEKNKNLKDKKERMSNIQNILQKKIFDFNEIDEEIIGHFLKKITVKDNDELDIVLNGDYEYIARKQGDRYVYENVSSIVYLWTQTNVIANVHHYIDKPKSYKINVYIEI